MVVRSISQGLQQWVTTLLGGAAGLNDEELKAQAIKNQSETDRLVQIENARGAVKLRLMTRLGILALVALAIVVGAMVVIIQAAGDLELPWSRIGTAVLTFLCASGLTGLATRWFKRRRAAGTPTAASASQTPPGGDPNQMTSP
ncbi:hypothetical protein HLK59_17140 [Streptomyces sp. S3(2020)]|uniref:hypothetical protein n=1 Tax=Streptomyces sp. S3(2020) TaxID=2732044 RepID=UPI001487C254|nr:hypothetical protein [Streptomyces sp. S3(2020)]NNN32058.1 hypothetical protein [Streptomyces sp. S3(2020)]